MVDKKEKNECWPWIGSFSNNIPVFSYNHKGKKRSRINADKLSFILNTGIDVSGNGNGIIKNCNNLSCCNPDHIENKSCYNSLDDNDYIERFWRKVSIESLDGCWNWMAHKNHDGYGVSKLKINGKWSVIFAHRVSYYLYYGVFIEGDNRCLHKCDNPSCVNPNHLFIGTQGDNVRDMHSKNRQVTPKGSASGMSKLNESQVIEIKEMLEMGVSAKHISEKFGVCKNNIYSIKNGKTWKGV